MGRPIPIHCLGLALLLGAAGARGADPPPAPLPPHSAVPSVPAPANPQTVASTSAPPFPPAPSNPVDTFRQLLAMAPAQREHALADKPEDHRAYLRDRLQEFDSVSPAERELRLRLLQLRFFLLPLLRLAPADRAESLRLVPASDRELILDRLREWDRLPAEHQREFLENESRLRWFPKFEASSPTEQQAMLRVLPAERRTQIQADLARWWKVPADQRQRLSRHFTLFLELSDSEKQAALRRLSSPERSHLAQTLSAFASLPPDQRAKCIEAFNRFLDMNEVDQARFLQKAARWDLMTPAERRAWREFVAKVPPLPPGLGPTPPLPPTPSSLPPLPNSPPPQPHPAGAHAAN
ncbi:MAG: DUF3106 domain-containing protein [Verrucomicrobia bacterium]|nr:DUF3106 domain-containing protein [Verrucomicrobiota bacterium]